MNQSIKVSEVDQESLKALKVVQELFQQDHFEEAKEVIEKYLIQFPDSEELNFLYILILRSLKLTPQALKASERFLERFHPREDVESIHSQLTSLAPSPTDLAEAQEALSRALSFVKADNTISASALLEELDQKNYVLRDLSLLKALVHLKKKDFQIARKEFVREIVSFPDNEMALSIYLEELAAQAQEQEEEKAETLIFIAPHRCGTLVTNFVAQQNYTESEIVSHVSWTGISQHIADRTTEQLRQIKYLTGHGVMYGVHNNLPNPCSYFSVIRDPVERAVSAYYFSRETEDHAHHQDIVDGKVSIVDYQRTWGDMQAKMVLGYESYKLHRLEDVHIQRMLNIVDNEIALVGVTDLFYETLFLLKKTFQWKEHVYWVDADNHRKETKTRPPRSELSEDVVQGIKEFNRADVILYDYCKNLLLEKMHNLSDVDKEKFEAYKLKNKTYTKIKVSCPKLTNKVVGFLIDTPPCEVLVYGFHPELPSLLYLLSTMGFSVPSIMLPNASLYEEQIEGSVFCEPNEEVLCSGIPVISATEDPIEILAINKLVARESLIRAF